MLDLNMVYSILGLVIFILIIFHEVLKRRSFGNSKKDIILSIKIQTTIAIILSVAFIIDTSIAIFIKESAFLIVIDILATIIWENNANNGVRVLRILKERLDCTNNNNI